MRRSEAPHRLNSPGITAPMTLRVLLVSFVFTLAARAQQPDTAAKKPPNPVANDTIFTRARQLVLEGNGPQGRALVDSVIAQTPAGTPTYAEALYWRASLSSAAAEAERDYRRIIVEYPLSPRAGDALFSLAQLEMARGDRENATAHLEHFMLDHPESPDRARAGLSLSRLLIEQGRVPRGCATLGRARSSLAPDAVELKNQFDYYAQRCVGVDTVEVVAAKPKVSAAPPSAASPTADSVRSAARRPVAPTRTDSAKTAPKAIERANAPAPNKPPATAPTSAGVRAPAPTTTTTTYTIQVAAFDTKAEADQLAERLKNRGLIARVFGTAKPFRVRIGRFATQEAASDLLKQLRTQNVNGFVTVAEPGTK